MTTWILNKVIKDPKEVLALSSDDNSTFGAYIYKKQCLFNTDYVSKCSITCFTLNLMHLLWQKIIKPLQDSLIQTHWQVAPLPPPIHSEKVHLVWVKSNTIFEKSHWCENVFKSLAVPLFVSINLPTKL